MDKYILERDGQLDFYKVFLPRVNPALDIDEILADNYRFERRSFPMY